MRRYVNSRNVDVSGDAIRLAHVRPLAETEWLLTSAAATRAPTGRLRTHTSTTRRSCARTTNPVGCVDRREPAMGISDLMGAPFAFATAVGRRVACAAQRGCAKVRPSDDDVAMVSKENGACTSLDGDRVQIGRRDLVVAPTWACRVHHGSAAPPSWCGVLQGSAAPTGPPGVSLVRIVRQRRMSAR